MNGLRCLFVENETFSRFNSNFCPGFPFYEEHMVYKIRLPEEYFYLDSTTSIIFKFFIYEADLFPLGIISDSRDFV